VQALVKLVKRERFTSEDDLVFVGETRLLPRWLGARATLQAGGAAAPPQQMWR
jgi:hypothetical protein